MDLIDILKLKTTDELYEMAFELWINYIDEVEESELAYEIERYVFANLKNILYRLDTDMLEEYVKMYNYSQDDEVSMYTVHKLHTLGLIYIKDGKIHLAEDVYDEALDIMNSDEFFDKHAFNNWVYNCIKFCKIYYGIFTLQDILIIAMQIDGITKEDVYDYILQNGFYDPLELSKDKLIYSEYYNDDYLKEIKKSQRQLPSYTPSIEEIVSLSEFDLILTNELETLLEFLADNLGPAAIFAVGTMSIDVNHNDHDEVNSMFDMLLEELGLETDEDIDNFEQMYYEAIESINSVYYRGYSVKLLKKL